MWLLRKGWNKLEQRKENKMGVMPIGKLLTGMSLPIMASMLVQALYNVVDSVFVAQYSENGLTAVSLAFPIQSLMIAVGVGTGVGINALLSRRLGERDFHAANAIADNGMFLSVCSWIVFAVLGGTLSGAFFRAFTDNPEIIEMGTQYLSICTVFSLGVFVQIAAERIMQSTGNTIYNMVMQGTGAIVNIILDPIFIFGLFGVPQMGVAGAAIATVAGQMVAMALGLYLNYKKNKEVTLSVRGFRPNKTIIGEIYRIGVPSIIMQSIVSLLTFGMNKILIMFSEVAVSVFGIYFKLQSFVFMPIFGLTNAMVPIVAYNYGARKRDRILQTIKLSCIISVSIMIVGMLIFLLVPDKLLYLFNASEEMYSIGVPALRIISLSFLFAGVAIVFSSTFQALGNSVLSLLLSVTRQIVVILPAAFLLAKFIGLGAVWYSFPIAEIISIVLSSIMFRYVYRIHLQTIPDTD